MYNANNPGKINVALSGAEPVNGPGQPVPLNFTVNGAAGSSTVLTFSNAFLNDGAITAVAANGSFTVASPTGSLAINLGPAEAVAAGAQWCVDQGQWQNSGATVCGLGASSHQVDYKDTAGYNKPASEPVTITAGQAPTRSTATILRRLPI